MSRRRRPNSPTAPPPAAPKLTLASPRQLAGTRLRVSSDSQSIFHGVQVVAPPEHEMTWRNMTLDSQTLDRMQPAELIELLVDLSPDISRALWDFLRMTNPGHEVKVLRVGSEEVDTRAQAAVDDFLAVLKALYGSVDVVIHRLFMNAFLRGAFVAELILDQTGRMPVDLAVPDSRWLHFRGKKDPIRGQVWELFQWQNGQQVSLDKPTIRYIPVDPLPGKPYGRSMVSPALFTVIFVLGMLHDLRRVVQQQGWPRLDLSINLERLALAMPADIQADPTRTSAWIDSVRTEIATQFAQLQPDDTYCHLDTVTLNRPLGAVDASSLGAIDGLMDMLQGQICRALKSVPLYFGLAEGTSEANANRQHELMAQGIKAIQHAGEHLLEHLLQVSLQVQGLQGTVQWRFAENRAAEMLRDQQTLKLQLQNAGLAYAMGLISQDEVASMALGKDKADQEEPRIPGAGIQGGGGGGATNPENIQAEPGANRSSGDRLSIAELEAFDQERLLIANGNGNGRHAEE